MTKAELKPCPFCGGEAEIQTDEKLHLWRVICLSDSDKGMGSLEISTCWFSSIESAVETWNNRPIENELPGKIGKLESEIERLKTENASLRNYLKTARFYLSKVDSYISPIADEAHYFWDIQLEKALKEGAAGYYSF